MDKRYWRCTVCNDVHYGVNPPEDCPTCRNLNVYVEITKEEAMQVMGETKAA